MKLDKILLTLCVAAGLGYAKSECDDKVFSSLSASKGTTVASMIDQLNILQATLLGMKQAVAGVMDALLDTYPNATFSVMVDGNKLPVLHDLAHFDKICYQQAVVKGDGKHACISGASVLAKVTRDQDMIALAKLYPNYGIEKHKGYPTPLHLQAIKKYGILPMHRKSFAPIKRQLAGG